MSTRQFPFLVRSEASVRSQGRGPTGQPGPVRGVGETGRRASAGSAGQTARAQGQRARAGRPSGLRVRSWVQGEGSRRRGGGEGGGRDGSRNRLGRVRIVLTSRRPQGDLSGQARGHAGPPTWEPPSGGGERTPGPGVVGVRTPSLPCSRVRGWEPSAATAEPWKGPRGCGAGTGTRRAAGGARGARAGKSRPGAAPASPRLLRARRPGGRCAVAVTATCGGRARCCPAGRARGADVCRAGGKPWGGWRPASWPRLGAACGAGRRQHGPSR